VLANDLRRWLDGRPITARRASSVEHAWQWYRRNPVVSSLAAALAVTIALSFVVLLALLRNAQTRQRAAETSYLVALNTVKDAASLSSQMLAPGASAQEDPFVILLRGLRSHQKQLYDARQDDHEARDQLVQIDLALADRLMSRGALEDAETILWALEEVLAKRQSPPHQDVGMWLGGARARGLLGIIANNRHRYDEAVIHYAEAIEKLGALDLAASCPERELLLIKYQVDLGSILVGLGRQDEGEQWLRRSDQLFKALSAKEVLDPDILQSQAKMLLLLGDRQGACEALRKALRTSPGAPGIALQLALELLESAESLPPGNQRQVMLDEAHKTLTSVADSVEIRALRDPENPVRIEHLAVFYQYLGRVLMSLGRRQDAIAGLQRYVLLEKALDPGRGPHSKAFAGVCKPLAMLARIAITPPDASESYPRSPALWDSARFMASTIGISSTSLAAVGWGLVVSEGEEAALCRRTNRQDRAREIVNGLEEFASQLVAKYPEDPFAHLAMSESYNQIAKNACRDAGPAEVKDALRQALDSARRALALDPRNEDANRAVVDRQRRFAALQTDQ